MKIRVLLLLLAITPSSAFAQDALDVPEQPEIRRYTVEMIIFSYAQNVSAGTEIFVPDEPPPVEVLDDVTLLESLPEFVAEPETEELAEELSETDDRAYELVMLAEEDFELGEIADRLQRLDAYEPLLHFGWTQPMYPDEETEPRPLSSFMTPPDGLQGELNLYLSRYLHLWVKLQLDAPVDATANESGSQSEINGDYAYFEDSIDYPVRYRIDEDRIFRNGELRYFDHPKFGVLAKITRAEDVELQDGEMLGDMELLGDTPE